ncbi:MAG: hypothetical protein L0Z62_02105 [Gemmataceae bacterium]|nr:hypothetical protein [Gemmataceae bacterium]
MAEHTGSGNLKDKAENLGAAAGRKVGEGLSQAQQTASNVGQKAQEAAAQAGQKAQEMASNVAHKAQEAASAAAGKAEDALSAVGGRMSSLAGTLREKAPQEGMIGSAASTVADQLQAGGHYLQEHGFREMTDDLTAVIRHYPVQSVLVALGIGFFAGMASRR